jgi:hypothetical protein
MKAIINYSSGWVLEIPTRGHAPMLFLEWISEFRSGSMPVQKVINNNSFFQVRLNLPKAEIQKVLDYINANLSDD